MTHIKKQQEDLTEGSQSDIMLCPLCLSEDGILHCDCEKKEESHS